MLDVDPEDFFGSLDHGALRSPLRQRIGDGRILRLIAKWLKAGVMEEARLSYPERGTRKGRGSSSFDFLGLTHYWKRSYRDSWVLTRKTAKMDFARTVTAVHQWCRRHRHDPLPEQHRALCQKLRGHYAYYGARGNLRVLSRFRHQVACSWLRWLQRRSQRATLTREQRGSLLKRWPLPTPRIRNYWTGPGRAAG